MTDSIQEPEIQLQPNSRMNLFYLLQQLSGLNGIGGRMPAVDSPVTDKQTECQRQSETL